jgi:tetratricopeptide (TPR) repeat protein
MSLPRIVRPGKGAVAGERAMKLASRLPLILALVACMLAAGCTRDPNVRKQKYYESGQRYFEKGKYHEAAIQFNNAVQIDPQYADAHYQLALTYLKLHQWNRGYQELSRVLEIDPNNYKAQIDLANMLISAGRYKEAKEQHLDLVAREHPDDPDLHMALANYQSGIGNLAAALQEMQKAISLAPKRAELYLSLGMLQFSGQQYDAAEASFKQATQLDPKAMNAQLALGSFYERRGRYSEAEQQFRHAVQVDPKDPDPRSALVRLLTTEDKKSEAETFLRQTKQDLSDNSVGYRMLGDWYFANGDIDRATTEYQSLYEDHPKDLQVRKNYTQLLILKNRLDDARKIDDAILKQYPQDEDALIFRGQILLHENKPSDAIDPLQAALRNDPDNGVGHYHLGLAFTRLGNLARAESEFRDAVRTRPDILDAQVALAKLSMGKGDWNGLYDTASNIIQAKPAAAEGYVFRAVAAMNLGQKTQAEQDINKAIEVGPNNPLGYIWLGNLRLPDKRYPEAEKSFLRALDLDPKSSDALNGLMRTYLLQKDADKAIAAANAQIAKVPDSSAFYDLLGTALFDAKKDNKEAEAALQKSVELDRTNGDAYLKLGQVQFAEGSTSQAIATYQQGIKDNPRDPALYIFLGESYEHEQSWNDAKAAYRKALEIQPENAIASNNLAYLMLQQGGNVDVALAMAQTARRAMPDSPKAADTLGWAYYQKGAYKTAIDLFKEALKKDPNDPTVHYHLGMAYKQTDQIVAARDHLRQVLKINPNFTDVNTHASDVKRELSAVGGL